MNTPNASSQERDSLQKLITVTRLPKKGEPMMADQQLPVEKALEEIKNGTYQNGVENVREIHRRGCHLVKGDESYSIWKDEKDKAKEGLPAHIFAGAITGVIKEACGSDRFTHSGLLCGDIDHIDRISQDGLPLTPQEVRDMLMTDRHVFAAWISTSGDGVKFLIVIHPASSESEHKEAFEAMKTHIKSNFGWDVDRNCSNSNRLCFVSYDPKLKINRHATPIGMPNRPARIKATRSPRPMKDAQGEELRVRAMLSHIKQRLGYSDWRDVSFAVFHTLGDGGISVLQDWMPEEKPCEYKKLFDSWKNSPAENPITLGTLASMAMKHGYKPGSLKPSRKPDANHGEIECGALTNPRSPDYLVSTHSSPSCVTDEKSSGATALVPLDEKFEKYLVESSRGMYYDGNRYFIEEDDSYIPLNQQAIRRHLNNQELADIDSILCWIERKNFVHYVGPLAGYKRGYYQEPGIRMLVTTGPTIIPTAKYFGSFQTIYDILRSLLFDPELPLPGIQYQILLAWLKTARQCLLSGLRSPSPVLALAGKAGCGKTLLITLIEKALGNRQADPTAFFYGKTDFNGDLIKAELLVVDDKAASTDIRARRSFGAAIKNSLYATKVRIVSKFKDGATFKPLWRMVVATNDNPESMLILPPLDDDIRDKIMVIRCGWAEVPEGSDTPEGMKELGERIDEELPFFLHFLENHFIIPEELKGRGGVKAFHHPVLFESLRELAPETRLLELIREASRTGGMKLPWRGPVGDLRRILNQCPTTCRDAEKLLSWHGSLGTYLARLADQNDPPVEKLKMLNGYPQWLLKQPQRGCS